MAQNNYPETMYKCFVINAPMSFSIIWTIVKGFLNPRTKKKITILGSKYKKKLLEYVDKDQLPEQYGGTCTKPISNCGPWEEQINRSFEERKLFFDELGDHGIPEE